MESIRSTITLPKLYTTYLKMYSTKCRFYDVQTILPNFIQQKEIN